MFSNTPGIILISNLSTFLPFLACTALLKNSKAYKNLIPLWFFFALALSTELTVHFYHIFGKPNAWIAHVYTLVEYGLVTYILSMWQKSQKELRIMRLSIPVYVGIYLALKLSGLENFEADTINYISRPVSLLLLSTFVFYTLHQLWKSSPLRLSIDFRFWILIAMLIYYVGSTIIFAFMYVKSQDILLFLIYVHAVLNILQNVLFTVGILCVLRSDLRSNRENIEIFPRH